LTAHKQIGCKTPVVEQYVHVHREARLAIGDHGQATPMNGS
jgi:hypothetical protein